MYIFYIHIYIKLREINFQELAHTIVGAGKSQIHRTDAAVLSLNSAGQEAGSSGRVSMSKSFSGSLSLCSKLSTDWMTC